MFKRNVSLALLALVLLLVAIVPATSAEQPTAPLAYDCRPGVASTLYYRIVPPWYGYPRATVQGGTSARAGWRTPGGGSGWNLAPWAHVPPQEFYCLPGAEWRVKVMTNRGWRYSNSVVLNGSNAQTVTVTLWW